MFDPNTLPFDTNAMLARLRPWVECESPTWDAQAVNRMMDLATRDLALLGAGVERIPGRMGFGDCLRATIPHNSTEPGILVMGHMDTVHPIGTLATLPWHHENGRCTGPGICDMKAGNAIALEAIRALAQAGIPTPLPVTILFTSDEEVGSPSTRDLIEAEAARHRYVLVPEPARPGNGVVTGRYAIARFNLQTTGRPSHAGARLGEGRSAIREMAHQILAIEALTTEDCTFSIGVIHAGQWVNCVPTTCHAEALTMAKRQQHLDQAIQTMLTLPTQTKDTQLQVTQGVTRPVWEPTPQSLALYEQAAQLAKTLGQPLPHASAGGGSDGNFTGAQNIPTLDGLGVTGGGVHTLEEWIEVESLSHRGRLMAGLLATLVSSSSHFPERSHHKEEEVARLAGQATWQPVPRHKAERAKSAM